MATAKRTSVTLRNRRRRCSSPSTFLVISNLLASGGIASAYCGVDVASPTESRKFFYLDTVNVTYSSNLASPALSCWCGAPGRATRKFQIDNVSPFNGSAQVLLNFLSDVPCWFDLSSGPGACGGISETFLLSPKQRTLDDVPVISISTTPSSTTFPLAARAAEAEDSPEPQEDRLGLGAKVALGLGIALCSVAIGAMAAFFYFRRRKRDPDTDLGGGFFGHDRRSGKKGAEKKRNGASSVTSGQSGQSDEPLCPIQPVFDGFPGSLGYEDVRSLHSATNSHSPTAGHSPTLPYNGGLPHNGGIWERSIEREELAAARLKSQLQPSVPIVVSYGPNPVTPTLPLRPTADLSARTGTISPASAKASPNDYITDYCDYNNYSIPPPAPAPVPEPRPSPPRPAAAPIVVSYGPNRVTPTPLVDSPTVPPDEALISRNRITEAGSAVSHERQFSWEAESPLAGAAMGPLPPYATTEDFEAMEKGAVRKLAEPQAEAELPPTKDGFYHYTSHVVEYELPGAAPQHEPQLPYHPYKAHPQAGPSGGGRVREIDEQKFLLSDVEISKMRAEKAKARAARVQEESYDLGEPQSFNR